MSQMKDMSGADIRKKYLRDGMLPTIFCNGCGHGSSLDYVMWAIEELELDIDKVSFSPDAKGLNMNITTYYFVPSN